MAVSRVERGRPDVRRLAAECGFELAGVARAGTAPEAAYYLEWLYAGMAGEMRYLTGHQIGRAHV